MNARWNFQRNGIGVISDWIRTGRELHSTDLKWKYAFEIGVIGLVLASTLSLFGPSSSVPVSPPASYTAPAAPPSAPQARNTIPQPMAPYRIPAPPPIIVKPAILPDGAAVDQSSSSDLGKISPQDNALKPSLPPDTPTNSQP
jgi:hypothetical protein